MPARPLQSVVLPQPTKTKLVDDVMDFVSDETAGWYRAHGIPYKRAYLFYGEPGAGKTLLGMWALERERLSKRRPPSPQSVVLGVAAG